MIVFISCVKTTLSHPAQAKDLFISPWFKKAYAYAKSLHPDDIWILSSEYGLIRPEKKIAPYDKRLNDLSSSEQIKWANNVYAQMKKANIDFNDLAIFLTIWEYRRNLTKYFKNYKAPLNGLSRGEQLSFLS
jgi:hypothetical protein